MSNSSYTILERILARLEAAGPVHGQQLRQRLSALDDRYLASAEEYFATYDATLRLEGKSIDFGVDCYLKLCDDMTDERMNFLRTGRYANSSYKDVEQRIYGNPAVMEYHMHGLALAQYLWPDQYQRIEFFRQNLPAFTGKCAAYLEVGGGHGLYAWTALKLLPAATRVDLLDISASSIKLARQIIGTSRANYLLKDIFEYAAPQPYDFITAGEIIEHLEEPLAFLKQLSRLLAPGGTVFLTTPVNAPMIDHIYLFNHVREIRHLLSAAGFTIVKETIAPSRDVSERLLVQQKIPIMFAAFLRQS